MAGSKGEALMNFHKKQLYNWYDGCQRLSPVDSIIYNLAG